MMTFFLLYMLMLSLTEISGRDCKESKEWDKYYKPISTNTNANSKTLLFNLSRFTGRYGLNRIL